MDLQSREAPFNGWGLGEITAYSRQRIEEVKPGAQIGLSTISAVKMSGSFGLPVPQ